MKYFYRCWGNCRRLWLCCRVGTWCSRCLLRNKHNDISRFAGAAPNATATGDIGSMVMYAGQGVGVITEIIPAGEVVQRLGLRLHLLLDFGFWILDLFFDYI
ncbi:unnamed protein product [Urochloa humidicola]